MFVRPERNRLSKRLWRTVWWTVPVLMLGWGVYELMNRPAEPRINGNNCTPATVAERFDSAELVVAGSVFAVLPSPEGGDVIIEPAKVYRGALPPTIRIVALNAVNGPAIDLAPGERPLQFASGQPPYLLFLHRRSDGRYDTRGCYGSRLLGRGMTAAEIEVLGAGRAVADD